MLKSNWPTKKLGEICVCKDGDWILAKDLQTGNDVRLIQLGDIGEINFLDKTHKYISKKRCEELGCTLLKPNDILLNRMGDPIGIACILPSLSYPTITAVDVTIIRSKKEMANQLFILYSLNSKPIRRQIEIFATGSTRRRISRKNLEKIKIHIPPLKIQQKIVERLDAIKKTQELNDKQIELSEELFQSSLHRELDPKGKKWQVKKLGEATQIKNGGTPSTQNPQYWNGKVLWVTPKELSNFQDIEIYDSERKITQLGLDCSSAKLLPVGAVLLTSRAPIGYVVIAGKSMATNQGFKNFICKEKSLNNKFFYYFLKYKTKAIQSLGRGATFGEVSKTIVSNIKIPLPPIETQQKIVEKLSAVQDYKKKLLAQKQKLQELFESCLDKAIKGELVS